MAQAKTLTQAELDQVLRYVSTKKYPERDRALLMTSFLAGLRVAEIASLTMGDVLNTDGTVKAEVRLSAEQTKGKYLLLIHYVSGSITPIAMPELVAQAVTAEEETFLPRLPQRA